MPNGFAGVCVLIRNTEGMGRVVVYYFSFPPDASPARIILHLLRQKEMSFYAINEVAFVAFENEENAIAETKRLDLHYHPRVEGFRAV